MDYDQAKKTAENYYVLVHCHTGRFLMQAVFHYGVSVRYRLR